MSLFDSIDIIRSEPSLLDKIFKYGIWVLLIGGIIGGIALITISENKRCAEYMSLARSNTDSLQAMQACDKLKQYNHPQTVYISR